MTWATQYLVPSVFRFREWKICKCFGGTVVYVHKVSTEMNLCFKLVTGGNAYMYEYDVHRTYRYIYMYEYKR